MARSKLLMLYPQAQKAVPQRISGLVFWLDADKRSSLYQDSNCTTPVTANSDPVGGWKDRTPGSTIACTNATAGRYPLYKTGIQNGKPGILFDGSNDRLGFSSLPELDGQATVITVFKTIDNNALAFPVWLAKGVGNIYRLYFSVDTNGNYVNACVFDTGERQASQPGDPTGANIFGMTNIEGSVISGYKNGVKTDGVVTTGTWGGGGTAYLGIYGDGASFPYSGYIHEILVYNRVLTTAELNTLWDYLGKKWGIECAGSPAGSPCGISSAVLWLDASRLPCSNSDLVNVLPDLSGSGCHAVQNTLTKQGVFIADVQNGLPGILMDAADDFYTLKVENISVTTGFTFLGVFKIEDHTPVASPMLIAFTNVGASEPWVAEFFYDPPSGADTVFFNTLADSTSYDPHINSTPIGAHIFGGRMQEHGDVVTYLDGATATETMTGDFEKGAYGSTNAKIGANIDGLSRWMYGFICELMAWNRALSEAEVATVKAYLANKWGITL
jgi:hypothetical protein